MNKSIITVIVMLNLLITATVQSATLPITSNGSLGTFSPFSSWTINTDTGGRLVAVNSNDTPVQVRVFDYTSINIPAGVTVKGTGSNPLILLATQTVNIDGTIDVSAVSGANGTDGFGLIGYGGGGAGGGGGAVAVFANTILIGSTGQILANGGDGGLPGTLSIISVLNPGIGGSGGSSGPSGGAGGTGGSSVAGGGGGGGGGGGTIGAGGGGGGGGAYNGPGGAGVGGGQNGTAAAAGSCTTLIDGANGGKSGKVGSLTSAGSSGQGGIASSIHSLSNDGTSGGNGITPINPTWFVSAGGGGGGGGAINAGSGGGGGNGGGYSAGGGGAGGGADICCFYVISTSSTCIAYVISTCTTTYVLVPSLDTTSCANCSVTYDIPSTTQTISTTLTFYSGYSGSSVTTITVNRTYYPCFGLATGIIKPGQVVMTSQEKPNSGIAIDSFGVRIVDERNTVQYLPALNFNAPMITHPSWVRDSIGQVFGVALDDNNPPNIYVTAGAMYNEAIWGTIDAGGGSSHIGTGGEIYRLDRYTGQAYLFAQLPNSGVGLGNISFDKKHHQFFVTNFMDGRIYRLNISGVIQSWYQPFGSGYGTGTPPIPTSGFCSMTARIWGIQMNDFDQRLYFSRWTCEGATINGTAYGRYNGIDHNQIWSIAIDGNGEFPTTLTGTPQLELTIPFFSTLPYSNPVSDISFSLTGKMMLAERVMVSDTKPYAHRARGLEYTGNHCNGWLPSGNNFYICNSGYANCAGGTDYDQFGDVWFTGDRLRSNSGVGTGYDSLYYPLQNIYGLQKSPSTGNNGIGTYPNFSPNHVAMTSIYIDNNNNINDLFKSYLGDVEVYKVCSTIFSCPSSGSILVATGTTCFCYSASSVAISTISKQTCPPGADGGNGGWGAKGYIKGVLYDFPSGVKGSVGGYGAPGGGGVINLGASSDTIVNNGRVSAIGGRDFSIGYNFGFDGIIAIYSGESSNAFPSPNGVTQYLPGANASDWLIMGGGGGGGAGGAGRSQAQTEVNSWNRYSKNWQTLSK